MRILVLAILSPIISTGSGFSAIAAGNPAPARTSQAAGPQQNAVVANAIVLCEVASSKQKKACADYASKNFQKSWNAYAVALHICRGYNDSQMTSWNCLVKASQQIQGDTIATDCKISEDSAKNIECALAKFNAANVAANKGGKPKARNSQ